MSYDILALVVPYLNARDIARVRRTHKGGLLPFARDHVAISFQFKSPRLGLPLYETITTTQYPLPPAAEKDSPNLLFHNRSATYKSTRLSLGTTGLPGFYSRLDFCLSNKQMCSKLRRAQICVNVCVVTKEGVFNRYTLNWFSKATEIYTRIVDEGNERRLLLHAPLTQCNNSGHSTAPDIDLTLIMGAQATCVKEMHIRETVAN